MKYQIEAYENDKLIGKSDAFDMDTINGLIQKKNQLMRDLEENRRVTKENVLNIRLHLARFKQN